MDKDIPSCFGGFDADTECFNCVFCAECEAESQQGEADIGLDELEYVA